MLSIKHKTKQHKPHHLPAKKTEQLGTSVQVLRGWGWGSQCEASPGHLTQLNKRGEGQIRTLSGFKPPGICHRKPPLRELLTGVWSVWMLTHQVRCWLSLDEGTHVTLDSVHKHYCNRFITINSLFSTCFIYSWFSVQFVMNSFKEFGLHMKYTISKDSLLT